MFKVHVHYIVFVTILYSLLLHVLATLPSKNKKSALIYTVSGGIETHVTQWGLK